MLRRSELKRKTPLRTTSTKRKKPAHGFPPKVAGHVRQKQAARPANAAEKRHHDRIAKMPCLGCGRSGVHVHHVKKGVPAQMKRDHRFVAPLCPECHQGDDGVHGLGSEALFEAARGLPEGAIANFAVAEWFKTHGLTTADKLEAAE